MVSKHEKTRAALLAEPPPTTFPWREIEAMFVSMGAEVVERAGSRISVSIRGRSAVFHRPHRKDARAGLVQAVRRFLLSIDEEELA